MLAAVIVVVVGTGLCVFIAAASPEPASIWLVGAVVLAAVLMVSLIITYRYGRHSSTGLGFWHALSRNHRDDGLASQYRPRRVADKRSESNATNRPITAEEAQEIQATSANTWVPSRNRERGQP